MNKAPFSILFLALSHDVVISTYLLVAYYENKLLFGISFK